MKITSWSFRADVVSKLDRNVTSSLPTSVSSFIRDKPVCGKKQERRVKANGWNLPVEAPA